VLYGWSVRIYVLSGLHNKLKVK